MPVDEEQVHDLLYQAYETELGGVQIYGAALVCAKTTISEKSGSTIWSKRATMSSWSKSRFEPSDSTLMRSRPATTWSATPAKRWYRRSTLPEKPPLPNRPRWLPRSA